ncbi:hypothetical protein HELRODRAFT_166083 [Helobdella robusta]|uniref:Oxidative stress-responsive serine-rich protein 1 n=1 Tax=Helobdella robusta TaxID=6412 RepID=T1EXQ4_HELRO|nr:hypothetical protein HELRODRAFT_166083 [Helobdella robusta]ESN90417.1 hypothetical protein HELRODRAFT_166083 [Helobdella robusta]
MVELKDDMSLKSHPTEAESEKFKSDDQVTIKNESAKRRDGDDNAAGSIVPIVRHSSSFEKISTLDFDVLSFVNEHCSSRSCRCRKSQKRSTKVFDDLLDSSNVFGPSSPKLLKLKSNTELASPNKFSDFTVTDKTLKCKKLFGVSNKVIKSHSTENTKSSFDLKWPSLESKFRLQDFRNLVNVAFKKEDINSINNATNIFNGVNFKTIQCNASKHFLNNEGKKNYVGCSNLQADKIIAASQFPTAENSLNKTSSSFGTHSDKSLSSKLLDSLQQQQQQPPEQAQQQPLQLLSSCSQEAFSVNVANTLPGKDEDDWTMEELSCYFDDLCHIPKNMSEMAKMMYA